MKLCVLEYLWVKSESLSRILWSVWTTSFLGFDDHHAIKRDTLFGCITRFDNSRHNESTMLEFCTFFTQKLPTVFRPRLLRFQKYPYLHETLSDYEKYIIAKHFQP